MTNGTSKGLSTMQKKVNNLKKQCSIYQKSIKAKNLQNNIDHVFKQYIRENHTDIYWKAVKHLEETMWKKKLQ